MEPNEREFVLRESQQWVAMGIIDGDQAAAIQRLYPVLPLSDVPPVPPAPTVETQRPGLIVLYALAGILLGAAGIAFAQLMDLANGPATAMFSSLAAVFFAAGTVLANRGKDALADSLLVACSVALVAAAGNSLELTPATIPRLIASVALAGALLLQAFPRATPSVQVVALLAVVTASGILARALFSDPDGEDPAMTMWLVLVGLNLAALTVAAATRRLGHADLLLGGAAVCIVVPLLGYLFSVHPSMSSEADELLLGGAELALLLVGLVMRRRGMVIGAAVVVAVDAIVFAFDVGGPGFGVVTLLAVAGGLIALATMLARRTRPGASSLPPKST